MDRSCSEGMQGTSASGMPRACVMCHVSAAWFRCVLEACARLRPVSCCVHSAAKHYCCCATTTTTTTTTNHMHVQGHATACTQQLSTATAAPPLRFKDNLPAAKLKERAMRFGVVSGRTCLLLHDDAL